MQPTLYAILSDIHANYQALQAVEADALSVRRALKARSLHFVVLGDVVDYGPQPNECMDWVQDHAEIIVQGNHDVDVAESVYRRPRFIAQLYWPITIWTRAVLRREHKVRILAGAGTKWQSGLCKRNANLPRELEPFMLFHSSLTSGHRGNIDDAGKAWRNIQRLGEGVSYGLFGHTHLQGYFVDDPLRKRNHEDKTTTMHLTFPEGTDIEGMGSARQWEVDLLKSSPTEAGVGETPWKDLPSHPTLFNPGGLGQPRLHTHSRIYASHDNRASYMLLRANGRMQFQFRRVPYDHEETIRQLQEEVTWPPEPHLRMKGSDILKEVEGTNPLPRDVWDTLFLDYRQILRDAPSLLPELIDKILVPQLR